MAVRGAVPVAEPADQKITRGESASAEQWGCTFATSLALGAVLWLLAVWRYRQEKLAISCLIAGLTAGFTKKKPGASRGFFCCRGSVPLAAGTRSCGGWWWTATGWKRQPPPPWPAFELAGVLARAIRADRRTAPDAAVRSR